MSASARLVEVIEEPETEIVRDATLYRFEFTFEAVWKALQMYLQHEGHATSGPRDVIRKAFKAGYIESNSEADAWLSMLDDRNLTTHIYRRPLAKELHERVVAQHAARLRAMAEKLATLPWG